MKRFAGAVLAGVMMVAPMVMRAQSPTSTVTATNSAAAPTLSPDQLTKTVHETWLDSGRDEDKFFGVVKAMAEMSAQKRGVSLPDTKEGGQKMGTYIKNSSRTDPDQLLYAVVDAAVRQSAGTLPHEATAQ